MAIATGVFLLTGGEIFQEYTHMYLYIPDATGLAVNSPVRVNGIPIGKVDGVALSGSKETTRIVVLSLKVSRDALTMMPSGCRRGSTSARADPARGSRRA